MHKLILWLVNHLMFGSMMMLAAAAPAIGSVDGGSDGAPDDTGGTESADNGDASGDAGEASGTDGNDTGDTEQPATETDNSGRVDGRQLPAELKTFLAELKGKNPSLAGKIKDAFFGQRELFAAFPGGLNEAKQLKQQFEAIGGAEGIQSLQNEKAEWDALDLQYTNADPRFVENIAAESPESFAKLAPHVTDHWRQLDQEGYNHYMSGVVSNTLRQTGVANHLYLIQQNLALKNYEEAGKLLTEVQNWTKSIDELAQKAPASKFTNDGKLNEREKQLADKEAQLFNEKVASDYNSYKSSKIDKEIAQYTKGVRVDPEKLEIFKQNVENKISQKLMADANYKSTFERYYNAGDREAILKFAKSRFDALLPETVKAINRILPLTSQSAKPAPRANGNGKPVVTAPKNWTKVTAPPSPDAIDRSKTDSGMVYRSQAILKSGQRVYWGDKVPVA